MQDNFYSEIACCGDERVDPCRPFAEHRERLRKQGYDGYLGPLRPSGRTDAVIMFIFIGSGPGAFKCKDHPNDPEPGSWQYNRLVHGEYSLGGQIGWQLASSMAEAYRMCGYSLPDEIESFFPRFKTGPRKNPELTDAAIRASHRFFPAWHTNAVKCHEGPTFTSSKSDAALLTCVKVHLTREIQYIKPRYLVTLGGKAMPAVSYLAGISTIPLGSSVHVSIESVESEWLAWWHNPQFNAHKDDFIHKLARVFETL